MSEAQNRASSNLLLLCLDHANEVDLPERVAAFPVALLQNWKRRQLAQHDAAVARFELTDEEAREVLRLSDQLTVTLQARTINVGGLGGSAPGAAGGGGGAIGPGAIGGPGGSVGRIELDGTPGAPPGTGGGGGGVLLPGAIPHDPADLARGGQGKGFSDGMDGVDGGDTTLSVGDTVMVRAKGGIGGRAGNGVRGETTKLAVSTLLPVTFVSIRDGFASIVDAGAQCYSVLNLDDVVQFHVFVVFEAGGVEVGDYTILAHLTSPTGGSEQYAFPVSVTKAGDVLRIPRYLNLSFPAESFGIWRARIAHSDRDLASLEIFVTRTGEA
jgi:hypothetical protein